MDNRQRAERAASALDWYGEATGDPHAETQTHLVDLLADLMHLESKTTLIDFEAAVATARSHFEEEK